MNFKTKSSSPSIFCSNVYRCISVNVNPQTGERHPKNEPLKMLKNFRTVTPSNGPVMGIQLAIRTLGQISIDDDVYVVDESGC